MSDDLTPGGDLPVRLGLRPLDTSSLAGSAEALAAFQAGMMLVFRFDTADAARVCRTDEAAVGVALARTDHLREQRA